MKLRALHGWSRNVPYIGVSLQGFTRGKKKGLKVEGMQPGKSKMSAGVGSQ